MNCCGSCGCSDANTKKMRREKRKFVAATTIGSIVALFGIILATSANFAFDLLLRTQMVLGPNSANFPFWAELPLPIKTSVYVFDITNSEDFSAGLAKPDLREVGPFVFNEHHKKVAMVWNSNGTVTYNQIRTYEFVPSESNGTLDDQLTILNVPAATVGPSSARQPAVARPAINLGLKAIGEKLFVKKSVREILFDGYEDPILTAAEILKKLHITFPGVMDKFGFYYGRNGSDWYDGVFNMFTGANNLHRMGEIFSWNYTNHVDFFPGACGDVKGVGDLFPPYMPDSSVYYYSNDLCRPIELSHEGWSYVKAIPGKRYRVDSTYFANSSLNMDNACFELGPNPLPSGVYNASSCRFGAPIFMSQPHFYQADPVFLSGVAPGSLKPDASRHDTTFIVEAQTGIPISVTARFQLNVLLENVPDMGMFEKLPAQTFLPVVWFETKFEVAESLAPQIWLLSQLYHIMVVGGLLMGVVGLGVAVGCGAIYSIQRNQKRPESMDQYQPIVPEEEVNESHAIEAQSVVGH